MRRMVLRAMVVALVLGTSSASFGVVIDFTGGTAYLSGGGTAVPNNSGVWGGAGIGAGVVDYYEENGFKLDFIGDYGIIGDYYAASNDVIHGHWNTGPFGTLTSIVVTKIDNTAFDLNYFILVSNTDTGGGAASGNEQAWITASNGFTQMLPSEDWGFVAGGGTGPGNDYTQIYLGPQFDNITSFTFTVGNTVHCFGMDEFYIDEEGPVIPAPGALLLGSIGAGLVGYLRRRKSL